MLLACCLRGVHDMKDSNLLSSSARSLASFARLTAFPGDIPQSSMKKALL